MGACSYSQQIQPLTTTLSPPLRHLSFFFFLKWCILIILRLNKKEMLHIQHWGKSLKTFILRVKSKFEGRTVTWLLSAIGQLQGVTAERQVSHRLQVQPQQDTWVREPGGPGWHSREWGLLGLFQISPVAGPPCNGQCHRKSHSRGYPETRDSQPWYIWAWHQPSTPNAKSSDKWAVVTMRGFWTLKDLWLQPRNSMPSKDTWLGLPVMFRWLLLVWEFIPILLQWACSTLLKESLLLD